MCSVAECENHGGRLNEDDCFTYRGTTLCAECVSAFVSWLLDGGMQDDPEQFDWLEEAS